MVALALVDVLGEVPDPRSFHGRVHPLPAVLGLVTLALLMGRKSLAGIPWRVALAMQAVGWGVPTPERAACA